MPWLLLPLLLPWPLLWALLGSGFTGDDWTLLALARHAHGPLGFFLYDHSFTYLYRPVAMGLWWLSAALLEDAAGGHYVLNLLLHGTNATLVAALLRAAGARTAVAVLAGTAFAVHPVGAGTTAWLSDRFDLLATLGTLGALRLLATVPAVGGARRGLVLAAIAVASFVAAGSKETAIVLVPAAWLWLLLQPLAWRSRAAAGLAVALPFAALIVARRLVLDSWGGPALDANPLEAFASGTLAWLLQWPRVLAGTGLAWSGGGALPLLLFASALVVLLHGFRHAPRQHQVLMAVCVALAGAAAVVQAPVTRLSLADAAAFSIVTNLRFYYLALAAMCVVLALAAEALCARMRGSAGDPARRIVLLPSLALALALGAAWAWQSRGIAQEWRASTAAPARLATAGAAGDVLQSIIPVPGKGCVLLLLGAAPHNPDFGGFSDTLSKAQLPRGAAAFDCVVLSEAPPWVALTHADAIPALAALPQRAIGEGRRGPQRSGSLAFHFPAHIDTQWRTPGLRSFRWNGREFVEQRARAGDADDRP